jgi:hypothetical protein
MLISFVNENARIVLFGDPKMGNFLRGNGDGEESLSERGLEMGTVLNFPFRGDSVRETLLK